VKTLALEDFYADPHKLDSFLDSGESVEVVRDGRAVAELVPRKAAAASSGTSKWPPIDYRARFLKMWGPDAFNSQISVAEEFDELRRTREL
jgi:antitoxin (DNA-binding transcriptional repressor) of toxin-antitoxin stability system